MTKIPEGWIETTLGKCGNIITGKTPSTSNLDFRGGNTPFITPTDINESQRFCNPERNISDYGVNSFSSIIVPKNTICYTSIASIGLMCLTKQDSLTNQQINSLIVDENNDYLFFYYYLKYITPSIIKNAGGTTVPIINKSDFSKISVTIPQNPQEQKAIAGVLSSFDDKIELLRAENQTLEEMGQTLFKERFGKYKVGDELPDGWKVGNIYENLIVDYGYPFKSSLFNSEKKGLPLIRIRDLKDGNPDVYTDEDCPTDYIVNEGDILAGMDAEFRPVIWKGEKGLLNQRVCRFRPKQKEGKFYILEFIRPFLNFYEKTKVGTTVSHLGKGDLDIIETIIPPKELVEKFSETTNPIFEKIVNNHQEIKSLSKTRDQLLPKLMSGEMRVEF